MANMVVTNVDVSGVQLADCYFYDELLTFSGSGVVVGGTLLARSTASGKLVPYVKGGSTDGNGVAVAVCPSNVASTGAGDVAIRAIVSGLLKKQKLVIAADGDDSNIDAAVLDALRQFGLVAQDVEELDIPDNQ